MASPSWLLGRIARIVRILPGTTRPARSASRLVEPEVAEGRVDTVKESAEVSSAGLDAWKTVAREGVREQESETSPKPATQGELFISPTRAFEEFVNAEPGERQEAVKVLIENWRRVGMAVPSTFSDEELQDAATLNSNRAMRRYFEFLIKRQGMRKAQQLKREERRLSKAQDESINQERPFRNTFVRTFFNDVLEKDEGWRLVQAMRFGQPLLFDMSYEEDMTMRERKNCVQQMGKVIGLNRRALRPFHLHLCGLVEGGLMQKDFIREIGERAFHQGLFTITTKPFYEIAPVHELVYLTPDSRCKLLEFDPKAFYVIGGIVDKNMQPGLSLAKAKRAGIKTACLPLDHYLTWRLGSKNLTLNQMTSILVSVAEDGDWLRALQHVPQRKIRNPTSASLGSESEPQAERSSWWSVIPGGPRPRRR
uniref:tRNA methyltransferase 10 homolog C n=1 Tax=Myxine glutinosa TaxID=7769 RepID=UPI00358F9B48